jgi:transglutaminase-like putative cysteine protease
VDEENYYGFSDRINQNLRGTMEPQVVMRVRSQAPGFWRVMAFDHYTGQGWEVSDRDKTEKYERSNWSYRFSLPPIYTESERKEVIQTYTLVKDLPGIIPALDRPAYLYFPTQEVALDKEDALRSPVILAEGLTYSVISSTRYRDRTVLGKAGTEYKDRIRDRYLDVPEALRDRLRQYTESVLAKSEKPIDAPYEQALYLAQHLKQTFVIPENPLDLPFLAEGDDLVEQFLFLCENSTNPRCQSGGYPDHFSTVLTMMLRSIGIPSRLVVGFGVGEFNPFTGLYEVKNTDAYAMTEVYFPKHGWFAFDPIPGHEIIPPSPVDYEAFGVLRKLWSWVASWLPSPLTGVLQGVFNAIGRVLAWVLQQFGQGWGGMLIGLAALTGGGFLGWLGWYGATQWRYQRQLARLADADRLYRQILDWSAAQGLPKRPAQTPLEYLHAVRERYPAEVATAIERAIALYIRWHYGGERVSVTAVAAEFAQAKQTWRKRQR